MDQSKAFDRLSHRYLFKLLDHMELGTLISGSVKRIYKQSFTKIVVNSTVTEKIMIKSGVKQGCSLSMFLYILCIEELLTRIKLNKDIKGLKFNIYNRFECKAVGYADDIAGTLIDYQSIGLFFQEFKDWGGISGAILNTNKTQILALNSNYTNYEGIQFINSLKILGIEFNRNGVSKNNIIKAIENLSKSVNIWKTVKTNMLERIVICKTFILSKLWYVVNFLILEEKYIVSIERMIFMFIWNSPMELIKRKTLCLDYEEGGLKMICIRTKIKTILLKNFLDIILNKERMFYQLSVKWLKFKLRGYDY